MPEDRPGFLRRVSSKAKTITRARRSSDVDNATSSKTLDSLSQITRGGKEPAEGTSSEETAVKPPDPQGETENPASRWYLHARAMTLRQLASLGFALQNRSDPPAPSPTSSKWIDSTLSEWSGRKKIGLDIWQPTTPNTGGAGRVGVVVFHGGGFVIGNGTDDARWAAACMQHLDAVVIAVNYRCAPSYPFPTPVEDCADAILQIAQEASSYDIDPNKLFLSGFSAGGNLAPAAYYLLTSGAKWGYKIKPPRIRGIVLFYPLLDFTIPRKEKKESCCKPEHCLPDSLTSLFDQSYLHPSPDRSDPRISPALATDDLVEKLPPIHLCCCEYDMLEQEAEAFRDRLESMGKMVSWRLVKEEKHGWDKPPPMTVKDSVAIEYEQAALNMKRWLGEDLYGEEGKRTAAVNGERKGSGDSKGSPGAESGAAPSTSAPNEPRDQEAQVADAPADDGAAAAENRLKELEIATKA